MQLLLSIVGFLILNVGLIHYFTKLKKNQTPKNPIGLKLAMLVSSVLSIYALIIHSYQLDVETAAIIFLAFFILPTSAMFTYFLATAKTPVGDIKVKVGDELLPFKTDGFDSKDLVGKRTLLKFYRGAWCPYCSAELVMFEQLKPKLSKYGVEIVAISNDSTSEQLTHKQRDNLSHALVSDPAFNIIRQYGVEHHKGFGSNANETMTMFGITMPLPWKMKFKAMSIPTSILVNEEGKIVWIDQSDDYRLRASEQAVMTAVTANFSR